MLHNGHYADQQDGFIPKRSSMTQLLYSGGHLLFFINDLPGVVTITVPIYADDTNIYRSVNDIRDIILLQEDLNKLHQWFTKWQLKFNANTC